MYKLRFIVLMAAVLICSIDVSRAFGFGLHDAFGLPGLDDLDVADYNPFNIVVPTMKPMDKEDIEKLKPNGPNDNVTGELHMSHSSIETKNGEVVNQSSGSTNITNDNGVVKESTEGN